VIIRVFRPTIHPGKEDEFEAFLRETAVPLVSKQSGLVAQHVGTPREPSSTEYLYVTVWDDVESIRAFAGERWQEAVIAPDEEHLLKDTWIGHYEALEIPTAEQPPRVLQRGHDGGREIPERRSVRGVEAPRPDR
jgi:heme-degrading monooxygenase HmoA